MMVDSYRGRTVERPLWGRSTPPWNRAPGPIRSLIPPLLRRCGICPALPGRFPTASRSGHRPGSSSHRRCSRSAGNPNGAPHPRARFAPPHPFAERPEVSASTPPQRTCQGDAALKPPVTLFAELLPTGGSLGSRLIPGRGGVRPLREGERSNPSPSEKEMPGGVVVGAEVKKWSTGGGPRPGLPGALCV